jgi:hypothetical protein
MSDFAKGSHMKRLGLLFCLVSIAACSGSSASVGSSGGGTGTGENPAGEVETLNSLLSDKVSVRDIAVFQGVRVGLVKDGASAVKQGAPIVAGRRAVIRVYVTVAESENVTCALSLKSGDKLLTPKKVTKTVTKDSTDKDTASVFDFDLKPEEVTADLQYSVILSAEDSPAKAPQATSPARYPQDGSFEALGASSAAQQLKVVLVPLQYTADGSGRLPDTSDGQLEIYRRTMMSLYPTAAVDISVREPLQWQSAIAANGSGFSNVLNAMTRLRSQDRAEADVYYYGIFAPRASFSSYCQQGCVTGLSALVEDAEDSVMRASIGLGFSGPESANTMAHEIGHAHGRPHAPCGGAQGIDRSYPYAQAAIGAWGFNVVTGRFIDPDGNPKPRDMMGYCDPAWISDYQFGKLFDRITAVNAGSTNFRYGASAPEETYDLAHVDAEGAVSWQGQVRAAATLRGQALAARWINPARAQRATQAVATTAHFYAYDHLPGGMLLVKHDANALGDGAQFELSGRRFAAP